MEPRPLGWWSHESLTKPTSRLAGVIPATLGCNNDADHMGLEEGCRHLSAAAIVPKNRLAAATLITAGVAASQHSVPALYAHTTVSALLVFLFTAVKAAAEQQQQGRVK